MSDWSRREFLKATGAAGLLAGFPTLLSAAEALNADAVCISILHTTDLHGHILPTSDYAGNPDLGGLARCVTQIRKWRRQNRNAILIDVGDVYQGTEVGLRSKGELMIDLFNHLKYDAWIVGNHEFDWGIDVFANALRRSTMPVLAANMSMEGIAAGDCLDPQHPFAKVRSCLVREIGGIKIALIGVTTPGMPFWLRPEFTRGLDFRYPVEPVRRAIVKAKSEGVDAIILSGHMGLKPRTGGDDFANNVMALTLEFPQVIAFIAGHTHQAIPSRLTSGILLTQADHFGIHVGRVDLVFDRHSKKLIARRAACELMDKHWRLDPVVLSRAKPQLEASQIALAEPIGELAETLPARGRPGEPSELEQLIGAAIMESLSRSGVTVDGVMHGTFDEKSNLLAGPKTINDIWNIIPYENYLVTAELSPDEIKAVMEETFTSHERRCLLGFEIATEGTGQNRRVVSMRLRHGKTLERDKRYLIAVNTFDSRSAGHRFMKLRALLDTPAAHCNLHPIQTRDALIDYFRRRQAVHKIADTLGWAQAA